MVLRYRDDSLAVEIEVDGVDFVVLCDSVV